MKRTGKRFFANFTVASSHELPPRWPGRVSVLPTDNDDDDLSSGRSYGFSATHTIPLLQNPVRMSHYSFGEYISTKGISTFIPCVSWMALMVVRDPFYDKIF